MTDLKQICWIHSYPKSGNTWVRLLLDGYFRGEVDINEILTSVGDDGIERYQTGDGSNIGLMPVDIQQLTRPMAMLRTVQAWHKVALPIPLFVKTHQANVIANGIELMPAALTKATIHIVRDPRDVMPSFANHLGHEHDKTVEVMTNRMQVLQGNENRVSDYLSSWSGHTDACLSANDHNPLLVRYEDLRADPEQWLGEILAHIEVDPDKSRVARAVDLTELSKLRKAEQEKGFGEGSKKAKEPFFNSGTVGKKIAPHHKSKIERAFRKTMTKLGYLRSKHGAIDIH